MVFSKILKKLQMPKEYSEAALESTGTNKIQLTAQSSVNLKPGDIATFSYDGSWLNSRMFLVVSTRNAPDGKFTSSRGNYLICGYDLSRKETLPGLVMIFNSFYKKRRSTYKRLKKLMNSMFGEGNYKTFNTIKMSSVFSLDIEQENKAKVR